MRRMKMKNGKPLILKHITREKNTYNTVSVVLKTSNVKRCCFLFHIILQTFISNGNILFNNSYLIPSWHLGITWLQKNLAVLHTEKNEAYIIVIYLSLNYSDIIDLITPKNTLNF